MGVKLLAPEAAGKTHLFAVRPDKAVWDPVHAAYHGPVFVELTKPVIVQRTHNAGPKALSQENSAPSDILPGSVYKLPLFFIGTGSYSIPKISPFYIRMVLEMAGAAVVSASAAREADLVGVPVVCALHIGVEQGQLCEQGAI